MIASCSRAARGGYLVLLLAAAVAGLTAQVRAQLGQRLWQLGDELAALDTGAGADSTLELNGATLQLSSLTVEAELGVVLDRFDALCAKDAPSLTAELQRVQPRATHGALLREQNAQGAVALCLAQPTDASLQSLSERTGDYAGARDLSLFGQLRYLRARRTQAGAVHVLFAHTTGPLPLAAMFPAHGDASGSDFAELPRPGSARRVLSMRLAGSGHGLVAYALQDASGHALQRYAQQLERNGFVQLQVAPQPSAALETRAFARAGTLFLVHARSQGGHSVLSAVRIGPRAPLTAAGTELATEPVQRDL